MRVTVDEIDLPMPAVGVAAECAECPHSCICASFVLTGPSAGCSVYVCAASSAALGDAYANAALGIAAMPSDLTDSKVFRGG